MPNSRMYFCDPPGSTKPENLMCYGYDDRYEYSFVYLHDQEPMDTDLHKELFAHLNKESCSLILNGQVKDIGHIVVSERGDQVRKFASANNYRTHYYFFHGWACRDWYRGYDRSFLIARAADRQPTKTFMSPNRIVGGKRDHRVLFLYHLIKQDLLHNHVSAPRICPYENTDIIDIAKKYIDRYQDIVEVFETSRLPLTFAGEPIQLMTSCWLSNFQEAQDSIFYVPTETVYFGNRMHLTEKTMKAIALEMPFILVAPCGSLEYLREYGFKTFGHIIDESYDEISDDFERVNKVCQLLKDIDSLSLKEKQQIHRACLPMVEHNYNHFYKGSFDEILWQELQGVLNALRD